MMEFRYRGLVKTWTTFALATTLVLTSCGSSDLAESATVITCRVTSEWASTQTVEFPLQPDVSTGRIIETDIDEQLRVRFFWSGGHLGVIAQDITGDRDETIFTTSSDENFQLLADQITIGDELSDSGPTVHHTNRLQFRVTCEAA